MCHRQHLVDVLKVMESGREDNQIKRFTAGGYKAPDFRTDHRGFVTVFGAFLLEDPLQFRGDVSQRHVYAAPKELERNVA